MTLRYGIPSYKRPECKTVDMLINAGVSRENIFVSLQDGRQLEQYKAVHPNIQYIVRHADCAAGNRNTLLETIGAPLVLLDDDIRAIAIKHKGGNFKRAATTAEFEPVIEAAIQQARENKCSIVGFAATTNDLIARNREEYSYDVLLQGSLLVVLNGDIRFDERWKMVEDYELSLRTILRSHTIRANYVSAFKPTNGTNVGGLHDRYVNGELAIWIDRLSKKYPMFVPNKAKTGGRVRFG